MPTITNTIVINAGPDKVWAVLSDMTATRQWLPGVVSARMDGDLRVCQMGNGEEVHEKISHIADSQRAFRFEHVRVPLPVRQSGGTFTVTPAASSDTATVTLDTTFEPSDPDSADQLTAMIHGAFQQSLESLGRFVETGQTWDTI